jgi:hypothetical protein
MMKNNASNELEREPPALSISSLQLEPELELKLGVLNAGSSRSRSLLASCSRAMGGLCEELRLGQSVDRLRRHAQ